jgi:Centromere DNA-binding protein complex CBF3 subunit, domain 2
MATIKKEMLKDSYGQHEKKILQGLGLSSSKLLHLGRNMGARILEMLEEESDEIRRMGQWSPSMFDNHYSCKLPLRPIRKLAGFQSDSKLYYNKRAVVEPSESMLRSTPMGHWCYDAYSAVIEKDQDGKHQTAQHVLRFLCELNRIFLQDAAAITVLHDRGDHPIFKHIPMIATEEWEAYCIEMKQALDNDTNPLDASLEKVLPEVHQRLHCQDLTLKELHDKVDSGFDRVTASVTLGFNQMEQQRSHEREAVNRRMATILVAMNVAQQFLLEGSSNARLPEHREDDTELSPASNFTGDDVLDEEAKAPLVEDVINRYTSDGWDVIGQRRRAHGETEETIQQAIEFGNLLLQIKLEC